MTANVSDRQRMLEEADQARMEAITLRDVSRLRQLLDPKMRYVHAIGLEDRRDEYLARIETGEHSYPAISAEEREIELIDDVGIVSGIIRIEVLHQEQRRTTRTRVLQVWHFREGNWQLLRYQSAALNA